MADHDRFNILAVDDDNDLRGVIARRFLRRGYNIEQTASPVEAIRRAEQKHFDVAILDIVLPRWMESSCSNGCARSTPIRR